MVEDLEALVKIFAPMNREERHSAAPLEVALERISNYSGSCFLVQEVVAALDERALASAPSKEQPREQLRRTSQTLTEGSKVEEETATLVSLGDGHPGLFDGDSDGEGGDPSPSSKMAVAPPPPLICEGNSSAVDRSRGHRNDIDNHDDDNDDMPRLMDDNDEMPPLLGDDSSEGEGKVAAPKTRSEGPPRLISEGGKGAAVASAKPRKKARPLLPRDIFEEDDIQLLICSAPTCTRDRAIAALQKHGGDLVKALKEVAQDVKE